MVCSLKAVALELIPELSCPLLSEETSVPALDTSPLLRPQLSSFLSEQLMTRSSMAVKAVEVRTAVPCRSEVRSAADALHYESMIHCQLTGNLCMYKYNRKS